jgi:Rod binding domain-containing protein
MIEGIGASGLTGIGDKDRENPVKVMEEFESIFISYLVHDLRDAFSKEKGAGIGSGGDIYMGLIEQTLSESLAKAGGIGLRDLLQKYLGQHDHNENIHPTGKVKV